MMSKNPISRSLSPLPNCSFLRSMSLQTNSLTRTASNDPISPRIPHRGSSDLISPLSRSPFMTRASIENFSFVIPTTSPSPKPEHPHRGSLQIGDYLYDTSEFITRKIFYFHCLVHSVISQIERFKFGLKFLLTSCSFKKKLQEIISSLDF